MTIEKALEILTQWSKENCPPRLPDEFNALKLGIEALKRIKNQRTALFRSEIKLLPGETEGGDQ